MLVQNIAKGQATEALWAWMWLIGGAVADVLIAVAMCYLLLKAKSNINRRSSDVVSSLVRMTIETNALTASIAIIGIALFAALPHTTYFIAPTLFLGKLYANTLLLTFNNRAFLRVKTSSGFADSAQRSGGSIPLSQGLTLTDQEATLPSTPRIAVSSRTITQVDPTSSEQMKMEKIKNANWDV